jgi:hypothetical protein
MDNLRVCSSKRYKCGCEFGFNLILKLCKIGININNRQVKAYGKPTIKSLADAEMEAHLEANQHI